jgi:anti-sigma regulatory factor (Ser/Thr protein kinase)
MEAAVGSAGEAVHALPPEPSSVPTARQLARAFAAPVLSEKQYGNFDLALTEVFSNAVRHSGSSDEIVLTLTAKRDYLCVRVTDGGAGLMPSPGAMSTENGAGFGLFLVEQLTRRWGMTREDARTRVWFEIDYEPAG